MGKGKDGNKNGILSKDRKAGEGFYSEISTES